MKYLVVVERSETGFSSYSPDLPGCVSAGTDEKEVLENMKEAIEFHIDGLKLQGDVVPKPTACLKYVEVAA